MFKNVFVEGIIIKKSQLIMRFSFLSFYKNKLSKQDKVLTRCYLRPFALKTVFISSCRSLMLF